MRASVLVALGAIVSLALASSLPSQALRADLYEWIQHPVEWQRLAAPRADARLNFAIGLVPANRDKLEAIFWDVTNPDSPNYQKWLSFEEVTRMTDPGQAVVQPVLDWLNSATGVKTHVMGEIIRVEASVAAVEILFQTRMAIFRSRKTGKDIIRHVGKSSVPRHIRDFIVVVEGIHEFPPTHHAIRTGAAADGFSVNAPSTYAKLYNIPSGTVVKSKASNGCFAQYAADGSPKQVDLTAFDANTGTPKQTFNYNGEQDPTTGLEATLDIQTMTSVAPNANTTFFMQQNWMYVFTSDLLSLGSGCPNVLSISYGWNEDQQCSDILHDLQVCKQHGWNGTQYIAAVDANLVKLGAAGVTIIASSGDNGAPGDQNVACNLDSKQGTYPAYPASSPYLLSVGATQIVGSGTGIDAAPRKIGPVCTVWKCSEDAHPSLQEAPAQTANASFSTGGGFSMVESTPSYQSAAVSAYLSSGVALPPSSKFNSKGRGYPDVAAVGQNNMIVDGGQWTVSGGTSASGPIWNGIITLLNDYLLTNGKPTLGFVNPLLYKIAASTPSAFNPIQPGNNKCTEQACCLYGFLENPKSGGWSPVTGLGSPNFGVIVNYLKTNIVEKK